MQFIAGGVGGCRGKGRGVKTEVVSHEGHIPGDDIQIWCLQVSFKLMTYFLSHQHTLCLASEE